MHEHGNLLGHQNMARCLHAILLKLTGSLEQFQRCITWPLLEITNISLAKLMETGEVVLISNLAIVTMLMADGDGGDCGVQSLKCVRLESVPGAFVKLNSPQP